MKITKIVSSHKTYKLDEHFCVFLRDLTIVSGKDTEIYRTSLCHKSSVPKNVRNCSEALSRITADNENITSAVISADCTLRNIPDGARIVRRDIVTMRL